MDRFIKWFLWTSAMLSVTGGLVVGFAYLRADNEVAAFLKRKLPSHFVFTYDRLTTDLFSGKISFDNVHITLLNPGNRVAYSKVKIDQLQLYGFSYWKWLQNNTVYSEYITVNSPTVLLYPYLQQSEPDSAKQGVVDLKREIFLKHFQLNGGKLFVMQDQEDSLLAMFKDVNFELSKARIDSSIIRKPIPIEYEDYTLTFSNTYVDISEFEVLQAHHVKVNSNDLIIDSLQINCKHGIDKLSSLLVKKHEHIDILAPLIKVKDIDYGFTNSKFFMSIKEVYAEHVDANIYLDKTKQEKERIVRPMYSKVLRELPVDLTIDSAIFSECKISYSEKIETDLSAGKIFFNTINGSVTNLSNTYPKGELTEFKTSAVFMNESPVNLAVNFDINNRSEVFYASGNTSNFNATSLNDFLISNLKVRANGKVDELHFHIKGDSSIMDGTIKMKYKDFNFKVLKKDRVTVKPLITAIGNLFINNGQQVAADGYRHGNISAEREKTKSFFNYLWLGLRDGLQNALKGNGKPEKK